MFSRTVRIVVVTLPLALGLGACKRAPKNDSPPGNTISAAKSPQSVTCPKGAPRIRVKDAQSLEFDCPEGGSPKVEAVATK